MMIALWLSARERFDRLLSSWTPLLAALVTLAQLVTVRLPVVAALRATEYLV